MQCVTIFGFSFPQNGPIEAHGRIFDHRRRFQGGPITHCPHSSAVRLCSERADSFLSLLITYFTAAISTITIQSLHSAAFLKPSTGVIFLFPPSLQPCFRYIVPLRQDAQRTALCHFQRDFPLCLRQASSAFCSRGSTPPFRLNGSRCGKIPPHCALGYAAAAIFICLQGAASGGKLDIKARSKTRLADYGFFNQALVQVRSAARGSGGPLPPDCWADAWNCCQCASGDSLFGSLSHADSNYNDVIVELDLKTGQVESLCERCAEHPSVDPRFFLCARCFMTAIAF